MNIMLVDDSEKFRVYLKSLLVKQIPQIDCVVECKNGLESVERYRSCYTDWVFMDIEMPEMNGLTALGKILSFHPTANIIIMTQYNDDEYRDKALSLGAKAFIVKDNIFEIFNVIEIYQ